MPKTIYTKTWERPPLNVAKMIGNITLVFIVIIGIFFLSYFLFAETAPFRLIHGGSLDPDTIGDRGYTPVTYEPHAAPLVHTAYVALIIWTILGTSMFGGAVLINYLLAPWTRWRKLYLPDEHYTTTTYECGEIPIGEGHAQTNLQYYSFAIVFVIFDVITSFVLMFALVFSGTINSPWLLLLAFIVFSIFPLAILGFWVHKKAILWQ